ncbi:MAG: class I SAM-dependent methyltransferase [Alphaproteobacteria bacterium]|nr:class I SAM-dependent methyltransferase [Alphaproteobacteria bacterium]MDE1986944.1 class I SAM-dependent methyltransferase [Alphaproteobacteria bacterium]MDE2500760.1 class I SAM-dependent methyltransferase [Alphaproteobacteria bacterium]
MRHCVFAVAAAVLLTTGIVAAPVPSYIRTALADPARPQADVQRDAERKPADMLIFAGIKPGMHVMDMIPGGGYFTRIFAKAVGPTGWVYSFQPTELDHFSKDKKPAIYAVAADYPNVSVIHESINKLSAPEALDVVWTSQNYHDLKDPFFAPADTALVNKAVYDALRPGGIYIVLDHSAPKGSGISDTDTLHRIDEAVVKKEVEAAGFKLIGESNVLRNPKDPRTIKVFDPSIRGHTDQFILKFQKPMK